MRSLRLALLCSCLVAHGCAAGEGDDATPRRDGATDDLGVDDGGDDGSLGDGGVDTGPKSDTGPKTDTGASADTGLVDTGAAFDTGVVVDTGVSVDTGTLTDTGTIGDTSTGPITGGPCSSGAPGATAFRIRWVDSGGTATVSYEVTGLPDKSGFKVAAYSTSFGYTPAFSDKFLAVGGLDLSSPQFVDVDLSTVGLTSIKTATLSLYGRSFATGASGSFLWNTFDGSGTSGSISNVAPYHWDSTVITSGLGPGKVHKLRIKPGPPSSALVIHRIELCIET
ncbi:MAG: hypothetical protein IPJ34_08965 [Myxococcales bacterium]|nr:hypothetical protein [Myxococcales bacterium]